MVRVSHAAVMLECIQQEVHSHDPVETCVSATIARSITPEAEQNNASATEGPNCDLLIHRPLCTSSNQLTNTTCFTHACPQVLMPLIQCRPTTTTTTTPPPKGPQPRAACCLTIAACTSGALTALKRALNTCWDPPPPRRMEGTTFSITWRHMHTHTHNLHACSCGRRKLVLMSYQ